MMNMQELTPNTFSPKATAFAAAAAAALLQACRKSDDVFELETPLLYADNSSKTKLKTNEQFINILYTGLFQTAPTEDYLSALSTILTSIGDQLLAREVVIANFFNTPDVQLPSMEEMRGNVGAFVEETYKNFYLRLPGAAEKAWVTQFIESQPEYTPELVYFAFALSNEYLYY
jgi:hypothetical protein